MIIHRCPDLCFVANPPPQGWPGRYFLFVKLTTDGGWSPVGYWLRLYDPRPFDPLILDGKADGWIVEPARYLVGGAIRTRTFGIVFGLLAYSYVGFLAASSNDAH